MKYVYLKLTEKEAAALYVGAMVHGTELNDEQHGIPEMRSPGRDAAAFWRAVEKLQKARRKAGGIY